MFDIYGWTFKTDWMDSPNSWMFFEKDNSRTAIIFGRNGSGKTTFSESVRSYKKIQTKNTYPISLPLNKEGKEINDGNLESSIFVFNESFVDNEIGFKTDSLSLNPIIMFGESKAIDNQIKLSESELETFEKQLKRVDLAKYSDLKNDKSLEKSKNEIVKILKQHWANRNKEIKNNKSASPVKEELINELENANLRGFKYNERLTNFNKKLNSLKKVRSFSEPITNKLVLETDSYLKTIALTKNLLETKISTPITDELETKILNELKNFSLSEKGDFSRLISTDLDYCPCCFQSVSFNHKIRLKEAFNKVINRETNDFINKLKEIHINKFSFDYSSFEQKVDIANEKSKLNKLVSELNSHIDSLNAYISIKIKDPYDSTISVDNQSFINCLNEASIEILSINSKIDDFNRCVSNARNIEIELIEENKNLAAFETLNARENHKKLEEEYKADVEQFDKLTKEIQKKKELVSNLRSQLNNTSIAINEINNDLTTIFGKNKSLQLYIDADGKYRIKSHNRKVKLENVSVGERNAIAISYFFSLLKQNETQGTEFSNQLFIVIDDPISSFDRDNKFGVLSLIQLYIVKILQGNQNSKFVFLTHDLMTMNYMAKITKSIIYLSKNSTKIKNKSVSYTINGNQQLEKANDQLSSDYINWISDIYNFASNNPNTKGNLSRLNEMRRALEAYSTFNYGCGADYLINEIGIKNKIKDYKLQKYFSSYVLKMSLDAGSHSGDFIKYEEDGPFGFSIDYCSDEKEKEYAKDLLCLLYSLDPMHLPSILTNPGASTNKGTNQKEIINTMEKWIEEIRNSITTVEEENETKF